MPVYIFLLYKCLLKNFLNFFFSLFQISYMISAWARMCKILGTEFQQYLPMVMGPVLKAVAIQPDVAIVNSKLLFFSLSSFAF